MTNNPRSKNIAVFILLLLAFVILFFACEFIGFISPWGWILFPALGAFVASFPLFYAVKRFGGKFILLSFALVWALTMFLEPSPFTATSLIWIVAFGAVAEILHKLLGYGKAKALNVSYPVFAIAPLGQIIGMWTNSALYQEIALEEMSPEYVASMARITGPASLAIAIVAILVCAFLAALLCEKVFGID